MLSRIEIRDIGSGIVVRIPSEMCCWVVVLCAHYTGNVLKALGPVPLTTIHLSGLECVLPAARIKLAVRHLLVALCVEYVWEGGENGGVAF